MGTPIRIGIGIQARISSRRFPNKVFRELWEGVTVLEGCLERAKAIQEGLSFESEISLLIPDEQKQIFEHISLKHSVPLVMGPENNVITRYKNFQRKGHYHYIVRLTADCPVLPPEAACAVIEEVVEKKYDYGCTRTPEDWFDGSDVEILSSHMLKKLLYYSWEKKDPKTREHVTWPLRNDPDFYALKYFLPKDDRFEAVPKLSIDTVEDLERVQSLRNELWWI